MRKLLLLLLLLPLCGMESGFPQFGMPVSYTSGPPAPVLFQHLAFSTNPAGIGVAGHNYVFATEPLPPNTVAVMAVTALHGKTITVSDTLAGTWSAAVCTADAGTNNYKTELFVEPLGATGGADTITVGVGTSNTNPVTYTVSFFENINTSAPTGGSLCVDNISPNSSGLVSPGSFTPTNNNANGGNVIWNYNGIAGNAIGNASNWTPASGFSLLNGDVLWTSDQGFAQASQYELQTTAASVTPSITATGENASTDGFNSVSVALKVANNSAVAPTTLHVESITHESFNAFASPGTMVAQWPTTGNLRVVELPWPGGCPEVTGPCLSSASFSDGCTAYVLGGTGGSNDDADIIYAQNCSACPSCTMSLVFTGSGTIGQGSFRMYDVQNAAASSYQNSAGGSNTSCTTTTVDDAPTFTPTGASSGIAFAVLGIEDAVMTALASGAPTGAIDDLTHYTGETSADMMENADGDTHYYYSSTAAQNWNWTISASPAQCYWIAAAFN